MLAKTLKRIRRKNRIRAKISGNAKRPRLSVFRSNLFISIQLVDDEAWITLASVSDQKMKKEWTKTQMAKKVGETMGNKMKDLKITELVFDRWGFAYHGRVKALADALRTSWIKF